MSMKILSPAGDFESLKLAVFNGADEVYLGVKDYNARNIEGFSLTNLKEAVDFAHIFGVKVNLTVNILFDDYEIQSALNLIVDAYNLGVDSFIIQDIGLASLINIHYPQIEMHASTQMGIHNLEGVKVCESLGFKRVVLSRETPLSEIKRIKENSSVEIEYFCQGALCVSFSGNCYMSSYLHNASGNRGKCKQLCRLPYSFRFNNQEIKNGYLLSAKDFNMLENLKDLEDSGVDVLKIEGRARRPYYVGIATKIYKQALSGEKYLLDDLMLGFNRGYTAGYFNGNGQIISNKQNHIGIEVGKVEDFKKGKKFNEIYVSLNRKISPKSVLKFLDGEDEIVLTAFDIQKSGDLFRITSTQKVKVGATVNLISDFEKENVMLNSKSRRKVEIEINCTVDKPIQAKFSFKNIVYEVLGDVCLPAKSQPIKKEDLIQNFNKSELFEANLKIKSENVFLTKKQLNDFRRKVFEEIFLVLTKNNREKLKRVYVDKPKEISAFKDFEIVENLNFSSKHSNIVYNPEIYELEDIKDFIKICESTNKKPYLNLPIFALKEDIEMLKNIVESAKIAVVVNNLYALNFKTEKVIGGGINVFNTWTKNYFNLPFIIAEGEEFKMPYMTFIHCPMKTHLNANCKDCPYKDGYEYVMQNGNRFKLKRVKMKSCAFMLTD